MRPSRSLPKGSEAYTPITWRFGFWDQSEGEWRDQDTDLWDVRQIVIGSLSRPLAGVGSTKKGTVGTVRTCYVLSTKGDRIVVYPIDSNQLPMLQSAYDNRLSGAEH
jgi:hypothetical protein